MSIAVVREVGKRRRVGTRRLAPEGRAAHLAGMLGRAKRWARAIKRDVHAVWLAARHPRTPWHAKALALAVAAYALSPIDLIPDVIPVLGYLDDLLIVPLGILAVTKLVPGDVLAECRAAAEAAGQRPRSLVGAAAIIALWLAAAGLLGWWLWPRVPS